MATIFLQIKDEIQAVQITELTNPLQNMVFIEFENGYSNIFFCDSESGRWVEQDLGFTRLAYIIGDQVKYIINKTETPKKKLHWLSISFNQQLYRFGVHHFSSGKDQVYEVYASNRRYMFSLTRKRKDYWRIFILPGTEQWDFDTKYSEIVPYLLQFIDF